MTYIICLILLVLAQVGDYYSTTYAIAHGAREGNPLVRLVGLLPAKLIGIGFSILLLTGCHTDWERIVLTAVVCAFFVWVVIHNILAVSK